MNKIHDFLKNCPLQKLMIFINITMSQKLLRLFMKNETTNLNHKLSKFVYEK